jgi:hypothetical protein
MTDSMTMDCSSLLTPSSCIVLLLSCFCIDNSQHWHVYQKWNERLFEEMYISFLSGRSDKDPSEGWFNGEIWFFDNYVIPLAKKLKECGVFGVSSDGT